jgi:hypothetical protein
MLETGVGEPCDWLVANRSVPRIVYGRLLTPSTCRSAHGRRGHRVSRAKPTPPARSASRAARDSSWQTG